MENLTPNIELAVRELRETLINTIWKCSVPRSERLHEIPSAMKNLSTLNTLIAERNTLKAKLAKANASLADYAEWFLAHPSMGEDS